jgi:hypothetical protein
LGQDLQLCQLEIKLKTKAKNSFLPIFYLLQVNSYSAGFELISKDTFLVPSYLDRSRSAFWSYHHLSALVHNAKVFQKLNDFII